ncbi:unnamed protein product [Boreogadus saida]
MSKTANASSCLGGFQSAFGVLPPAAAVVDGNRCVCDTGPLWGPPEALVSYTEALLRLCIQTSVVDAVVLDDVAPRSRSRGRGGGDPGP